MAQLPLSTPDDLTDENLAKEISSALLAIECAHETLQGGVGDGVSEAAINAKKERMLSDPGSYSLLSSFCAWRDYAFYGHFQESIESPIDGYALVLVSIPAVELYGGGHASNCAAILQAMVAREKLDIALGRQNPGNVEEGAFLEFSVGGQFTGLTTYELALLAGMSVQSVRNDFQSSSDFTLSKKEKPGTPTILPVHAYKWLTSRRGFRDSYSSIETHAYNEDELLVPQAKDGTYFSMECRQGAGFKVGNKGEDKYIDNFMDALEALRKMTTPYWRRPNKTSGKHGRVAGVSWVRKTRKELGLD